MPTRTKRSPAEEACWYILRRYVDDVNFRWHMSGTESLAKCIAAEASWRGISQDELRRDLDFQVERLSRDGQKARVCMLAERLDEVAVRLRDLRSSGRDVDAKQMDELIRLVEA